MDAIGQFIDEVDHDERVTILPLDRKDALDDVLPTEEHLALGGEEVGVCVGWACASASWSRSPSA